MDFSSVPLSAAIAEVRRELAVAIEEGKDSAVAFRAGPIEIEFDVAFESTVGGNAGCPCLGRVPWRERRGSSSGDQPPDVLPDTG